MNHNISTRSLSITLNVSVLMSAAYFAGIQQHENFLQIAENEK